MLVAFVNDGFWLIGFGSWVVGGWWCWTGWVGPTVCYRTGLRIYRYGARMRSASASRRQGKLGNR